MTSTIILSAWIVFFVLDFFVDWILDLLNINTIIKNREKVPDIFQSMVDETTYGRAIDYSLRKGRFGLFRSLQGRLLLILILSLEATAALDGVIAAWSLGPYWQGVVFLGLASAAIEFAGLPASLYSQFVIEEEFGFNTTTMKTVAADFVKVSALGSVLLLVVLAGLYGAMIWFGSWWWLAAWVFMTFFQILMSVINPTIIAPMFNKFEALADGDLKDRLNALAERCDFSVRGIFVMDGSRRSRHSNAYFTGIGKSRRIVIYDTLIETLNDDELEAVLAHEIGHWKHGHVRRRLFTSFLVSLALFGLTAWALNWTPLFEAFGFTRSSLHGLLFIGMFFSGPVSSFLSPLLNSRSRKHEYQADRYAVENTGSPEPMSRALLALGRDNLSNLTPHPAYSFWNYSHPALHERLVALKERE